MGVTLRYLRLSVVSGLFSVLGCFLSEPGVASPWPHRARQLEAVLTKGEPPARRRAALDLADLSESLARGGLAIALKDPDIQVRLNGAHVVLALDIRGLSQSVFGWLGSRNQEERLLAVEILSREPSVDETRLLAEALFDPHVSVRAAASVGLGRTFGGARILARSALMNGLDDTDEKVRTEVAAALGVVGDESVVVALAAHLPDASPAVRAQLAVALGVIGDPSAVPALIVASSDQDGTVVAAVARALGAIGAPESVPSLLAIARNEPFLEEGRAALEALFRVRTDAALEELVRHLQLPDSREEAADLLLALGAQAAPILEACISTSLGSHLERCAVLGIEVGVPIQRLFEAHIDGRLSAESLLALASSSPPSTELEVLAIEMLQEGDSQRASALQYLRLTGRSSPAAWSALVSVLGNRRLGAQETAQLLGVLERSEARRLDETKQFARLYLEATDSGVRAAATRLLVAQGAEGGLLADLIRSHRAEIAGACAQRLSEGMTPGQAATVLKLLMEGRVGRRSLLLSTLQATPAGLPRAQVANAVTLLEHAQGIERDAIFGALFYNGELPVFEHLEKSFDRADWLKIAQVAMVHPQGLKLALRVLTRNDPRLQAAALGSLALVGTQAEAKTLALFSTNLEDQPNYLRAAVHSALAFMADRGIPLRLPAGFLKAEYCSSPHLALRSASLRLATAANLLCPGADLERILLLDGNPLIRRTAAELLRKTSPKSQALRACLAYEARVSVAEACGRSSVRRPSERRLLEPNFGNGELPLLEAMVQGRGGVRAQPLSPVAFRFSKGTVVLVSDRRGRVVVPNQEFEVLPPAFGY